MSEESFLPVIKSKQICPENLMTINADINDFYKKNVDLKTVLDFGKKFSKKFKYWENKHVNFSKIYCNLTDKYNFAKNKFFI